jgi:hypothetical protein
VCVCVSIYIYIYIYLEHFYFFESNILYTYPFIDMINKTAYIYKYLKLYKYL